MESALGVLKIASRNQLAQRVNHHFGNWRGPGLPESRKLVDHFAKEGLLEPITVKTADGEETWFILAKDHAAWETSGEEERRPRAPDRTAGQSPLQPRPLHPALRLHLQVRGLYAGPAARVSISRCRSSGRTTWSGLIDGKRENGKWLVTGLDLTKPVDPDALRDGLHRFARIAGAEKVAAGRKVEEKWRRSLSGKIES